LFQALSLRLFVVEDNDIDVELIRRAAPRGCEIVQAHTGEECRSLFDRLDPDCVLLDYRLPDETGLDLLPVLTRGRAPVILMTGLKSEQIGLEAQRRGARTYICKDDISPETLPALIRDAIGKPQPTG